MCCEHTIESFDTVMEKYSGNSFATDELVAICLGHGATQA